MVKAFWSGVFVAAGLGLAGAASAATELKIQSSGLYDRVKVTVAGGAHPTAFVGPIKLEGEVKGKDFTLWAFCADLYHDLSVGYGVQKTVDLTYRPGFLTQDGAGTTLTAAKVLKMSDLAGYGFSLIGSGETDLRYKLAALQVAIWKTEYDGVTFVTGSSRIDKYVAQFVSKAGSYGYSAAYVYDVKGKSQALLTQGEAGRIAIAGIPEPAGWALLIVGFGGIGLALRNRPEPRLARVAERRSSNADPRL